MAEASNTLELAINSQISPTQTIGISTSLYASESSVVASEAKISATENAKSAPEPTYAGIPVEPTQDAVEGIKFDFNDGIRILIPKGEKGYFIRFSDTEAGVVLFQGEVKPGAYIASSKKFYAKYRLEIFDIGKFNPIFVHTYDAKDREVMIQLPVGTLGDSIGWFSYVERFQIKHQCKLLCVMTPWIADLVRNQYPNIKFITKEAVKDYKPYACYYMGLFFKGDVDHQPQDFRYAGLHRTVSFILGVSQDDIPPRFDLSKPRQIKEKYVCIAAQSSSQAKYWNNPFGWFEVVRFLKSQGYRVLAMDKEPIHGVGTHWNYIPYGAEDFTGNRPLQERVDIIKDADFFIGLSSGLSWVAWGCKVPVVLISGFTEPYNEFYTPYRVINYHACTGCWNDMRCEFDHNDFLWCPRHKNDERQFECSRMISSEQVIQTIKKIPTFRPLKPAAK